jgi:hypothetical protein
LDRCALLRALLSLCAESARLHDTLHGEEDEVSVGSAASRLAVSEGFGG